MRADVIVVGAGLSGLWTAIGLHRLGLNVQVLDARSRLGGRIFALPSTDSRFHYDLGPAWIWPEVQPRIQTLLNDLNLSVFPQTTQGKLILENTAGLAETVSHSFSHAPESMRIEGGMGRLIDHLAPLLPPTHICYDVQVTGLTAAPAQRGLSVHATAQNKIVTWEAPHVVLAMPPRLIAQLAFTPSLPSHLHTQLKSIPTWMAGQAKLLALYPQPFWRDTLHSGEVFSRIGPLGEIHDASHITSNEAALFGFISWAPTTRRAYGTRLIHEAITQLTRLFGQMAANPLAVHLYDWAYDPFTATSEDRLSSPEHPSYRDISVDTAFWANRLTITGTETASVHGGYLEGALDAAEHAIRAVSRHLA